jgi:hypothetical protein
LPFLAGGFVPLGSQTVSDTERAAFLHRPFALFLEVSLFCYCPLFSRSFLLFLAQKKIRFFFVIKIWLSSLGIPVQLWVKNWILDGHREGYSVYDAIT